MTGLANHLWQSTLFAAACLLLTLILRNNRAAVRHTVWVAASVKFLLPFSLFFALGSRLPWRAPAPPVPVIDGIAGTLAPPFAEIAGRALPVSSGLLPNLLTAVWILGATVLLLRWHVRWRRLYDAARQAQPLPVDAPVPVLSSKEPIEPGIFGILRPVLLVPAGIRDRFSPAQWEAILAHELCHVRRRDNLAAALQMCVNALFWFHPVVWWIGGQMLEERERACDEHVLGEGRDPETYATGILHVCRIYAGSRLSCAAGITGADLKTRIELIMTHRTRPALTRVRRALLIAIAAAAVAGPVWFGIVDVPGLRAQTGIVPGLKFDVASIKPVGQSTGRAGFDLLAGGAFRAEGITARMLITYAYDVQDSMLTGGPKWLDSDAFDIEAKPDRAEDPTGAGKMTADERLRARMRALLAERFHLETHAETKLRQVYVLSVVKGGPKLSPAKQDAPPGLMRGPGTLTSRSSEMYHLCNLLSHWLGEPVVDRTGIKGTFDYLVRFEDTPDQRPGPGGPPPDSFFAALQDQLGLKVERTRTQVESLTIDRIEKPSAN